MGRRREYIAARYDRGTGDRIDGLSDYVASEVMPRNIAADDVTRSEVLRAIVDFGLEVFERRAQTWRAEQIMTDRSNTLLT
jgi:hypothetical protein